MEKKEQESILIMSASEQNRKLRKDILGIWVILLIGFGNLLLIFGTHMLDSWLDVSGNQLGFTFFGVEIYKNVLIDGLYALVLILQSILMYFVLKNKIKELIGRYHEKD